VALFNLTRYNIALSRNYVGLWVRHRSSFRCGEWKNLPACRATEN
jgi:hypothetical protein